MKNTIITKFNKTVKQFEHKKAVGDSENSLTYKELQEKAFSIGTFLGEKCIKEKPIAILMERTCNVPVAMLGILASGNFYAVLDPDSPADRLYKILNTLEPEYIIYDNSTEEIISAIPDIYKRLSYNELLTYESDSFLIHCIQSTIVSEFPAYTLFTSGSTGDPKGVLITHLNVISYIEWFTDCFDINEKTVFGSQTPFYFSMSVSDFYGAMLTGATYEIIPKLYFAFPANLVNYMNEKKVNTIYWVPSALGIIVKFNLFKFTMTDSLEKVLFAGESMPVKYLNYLKSYLPNIMYANLFGPTETTDICMYYKVNREFKDDESLPIGSVCQNCEVIIVDDELYVKGPFIAKGYYRNKYNTDLAFIQNPTHSDYPDTVYRTGDLVTKNEYNEFMYAGRKDFQIKHLGYRIEPGEIETVLNSIDNSILTLCIHEPVEDILILAYESSEDKEQELKNKAQSSLPSYMHPSKYIRLQNFPINSNGKIDRKVITKTVLK